MCVCVWGGGGGMCPQCHRESGNFIREPVVNMSRYCILAVEIEHFHFYRCKIFTSTHLLKHCCGLAEG